MFSSSSSVREPSERETAAGPELVVVRYLSRFICVSLASSCLVEVVVVVVVVVVVAARELVVVRGARHLVALHLTQ